MTFVDVFLLYVCPTLGGLMSTIMFAAPINDMRDALAAGTAGDLNFFPFAMMTGNTIGWLAYGYFTQDPFIIASNLPGLLLSIWLNMGAAKLQYLEMKEKQTTSVAERNQVLQRWDADRSAEEANDIAARQRRRRQSTEEDGLFNDETDESIEYLRMTPQETTLLRVMVFWATIITYTSWLYPRSGNPANMVGVIVNINLVVFYAAPLKTIQTVVTERNSASIHFETMVMNWINTSFWCLYGMARKDLVIFLPNFTGLLLGIAQGVLCLLYPRQPSTGAAAARLSLHELESDLLQPASNNSNPEELVPEPTTELTSSQAKAKSSTTPETTTELEVV